MLREILFLFVCIVSGLIQLPLVSMAVVVAVAVAVVVAVTVAVTRI